jgi:predicted nucleic acid-binding protein
VNLIDSSAWLEFFAGGPNAAHYAPVIENPRTLIVPTIVLLEVYKRILVQCDQTAALQAAATMRAGREVLLDANLALSAAQIGVELKLALADSVIFATARAHRAVLWTEDAHFEGLPGVRYFPKRKT